MPTWKTCNTMWAISCPFVQANGAETSFILQNITRTGNGLGQAVLPMQYGFLSPSTEGREIGTYVFDIQQSWIHG